MLIVDRAAKFPRLCCRPLEARATLAASASNEGAHPTKSACSPGSHSQATRCSMSVEEHGHKNIHIESNNLAFTCNNTRANLLVSFNITNRIMSYYIISKL